MEKVTNDDLRQARMDRNRATQYPHARGHQMGFAMVKAVVNNPSPFARHVVLRIKGLQ
jgi:hypothetical protein